MPDSVFAGPWNAGVKELYGMAKNHFYDEKSRRGISAAQHAGRPAAFKSIASSAAVKTALNNQEICLSTYYNYKSRRQHTLKRPAAADTPPLRDRLALGEASWSTP